MRSSPEPRAEGDRDATDTVDHLVRGACHARVSVGPKLCGVARRARVDERPLGDDVEFVELPANGAAVLDVVHLSMGCAGVVAPLVYCVQAAVVAEAEQDRRERVARAVVDAEPVAAHRRQLVDDAPLLVVRVVDRALGDNPLVQDHASAPQAGELGGEGGNVRLGKARVVGELKVKLREVELALAVEVLGPQPAFGESGFVVPINCAPGTERRASNCLKNASGSRVTSSQ